MGNMGYIFYRFLPVHACVMKCMKNTALIAYTRCNCEGSSRVATLTNSHSPFGFAGNCSTLLRLPTPAPPLYLFLFFDPFDLAESDSESESESYHPQPKEFTLWHRKLLQRGQFWDNQITMITIGVRNYGIKGMKRDSNALTSLASIEIDFKYICNRFLIDF